MIDMKLRRSEKMRIYAIIIMAGLLFVEAGSAQQITTPELLDKFEACSSLESYILKTETNSKTAAKGGMYPGGTREETFHKMVELRTDGKRCKLIRNRWGYASKRFPDLPKEKASYNSVLWDGTTWYQFTKSVSGKHGKAFIAKQEDPARLGGVLRHDWAMGSYDANPEQLSKTLSAAKTLSVRNGMEKVRGSDCYVIEAITKRGEYTVWIDPGHGYNIARLTQKLGKGDLWNTLLLKNEAYTIDIHTEVTQFKQIDGVWFPWEATTVTDHKTLEWSLQTELAYKRTELLLNPDHDALGSFLPDDISNGTSVQFLGLPHLWYTWQDGELIPDIDKQVLDELDKVTAKIMRKVGAGDINEAVKGLQPPAVSGTVTAAGLLARYKLGQQEIQSFRAKAETTVVDTGSVAKVGRMEEKCDFRYDGSRVCHRSYVYTGVAGARKEHQYTSFLWDGKRLIQYRRGSAGQSGQAYISSSGASKNEIVSTQYRGSALLGFCYGDYERIDSILRKAKSVSVREATELVGRSRCYVIDAVTERGKYSVWFDVEHNYNIAKMEVRRGAGDIIRNAERVKTDMRFLLSKVRFGSIEGLWFPVEADMETSQDNNSRITKWHHKRVEILSNPDHEGLGSFLANDINDGTDVTISGRYSEKYKWQGGNVVAEGGGNVKF